MNTPIPWYAGRVAGAAYVNGTVFSAHFTALNLLDVNVLARQGGQVPGYIEFSICDGTTDIATCPLIYQRDLGAYVQPTAVILH